MSYGVSEYGTGSGQVHPGLPDDLERPETTERTYGDTPRDADLFKLGEKECAEELQRRWRVQDAHYQRWLTEWKVNARRLAGEVNVWAVKQQDTNAYQVYVPPGTSGVPVAVFNKAYRLCDRFGSVVFADDPKLEAESPPNDMKGAMRAQLATKVLRDIDSEGKLNDLAAAREAFTEWGAVTGAGYVHYFVDPHGGGRQPIKVDAGPAAQTYDDATRDPMTGQPWPELVPRFVREDGTLSDSAEEAAQQWQPALTRDVLGAQHVRFEPHTASGIWDAEGVIVAGFYPWEQVLRWFPKLAELPEETQERVTKARPQGHRDLLPWKAGVPQDSPSSAKRRERLVYVQWCYYLECPQYPDGFCGVVVGDHLAQRTTWVSTANGERERYDLPVTAYKQFPAADGNPHGWGLMHLLGPASEWRAELVGAIEDVLDRIRNRKTFIPTNSVLQGKQHLLQAMTYIPINEGGEPSYEEVPTDAIKPATELFGVATREMDDASTMQEMGQGMQVSNVNSGKQANAIQSAVAAGQSNIRQNTGAALVRAGRIKLQLLRGFATTPQLLRYADDAEDVREWMGSDLHGVTNIRLVPGSFSGLTPWQKAERAMMFGQAGMMPPDELAEAVQGAVGSTFGWQENPHARRARNQVSRWERAVRELDDAAKLAPPPMVEAPMPPPVPGQSPMMPQMMPGPDPQAAAIFAPRPVDMEPRVAAMRARIFGNAMSDTVYDSAPPAWRIALDQAYQQAVQSAQPPMPIDPNTGQPAQQGGGPAMSAPEPGEQPEQMVA
jgi:hypothetical protein